MQSPIPDFIHLVKSFLFPDDPVHQQWQLRDVDWSQVRRDAIRHGVLPICYNQGIRSTHPLHRKQVEEILKMDFLNTVRIGLSLTSELTAISKLFRENHIDLLAYKGPLLALDVYGDIALRQYGDLDFFIRFEDSGRAIGLLEQRGYTLLHSITDLPTLVELQSTVRSTWEHALYHADRHLMVELQPVVSNPTIAVLPPFDELWKHSIERNVWQTPIRGLSAEMLLLVLCDHGCRHAWNRLIWLMDIAMLIRRYPIDWNALKALADQRGAIRMILVALILLNKVFDVPIPQAAHAMMEVDRGVYNLANVYHERLLHEQEMNGSPYDHFLTALLVANQRTGWPFRVHQLLHLVKMAISPTDKEKELLPLPNNLMGLYRIVRPIRLLFKYLPFFFVSAGKFQKKSLALQIKDA